ncbi:hypothetical protein OXX59_006431, partial [Metschnikowia pulcherrima]
DAFLQKPVSWVCQCALSAKTQTELGPLGRFLFFLEKLDRIKLTSHIDDVPRSKLSSRDITKPEKRNYTSSMRQEEEKNTKEVTEGEKLKLRMSILEDSEEKEKKEEKPGSSPIRGPWYENALQQARDSSLEQKQDPALAVVCGPDGYVDFVAGGKDLATGEQGPVKGLLGANGWDETNVHKL